MNDILRNHTRREAHESVHSTCCEYCVTFDLHTNMIFERRKKARCLLGVISQSTVCQNVQVTRSSTYDMRICQSACCWVALADSKHVFPPGTPSFDVHHHVRKFCPRKSNTCIAVQQGVFLGGGVVPVGPMVGVPSMELRWVSLSDSSASWLVSSSDPSLNPE